VCSLIFGGRTDNADLSRFIHVTRTVCEARILLRRNNQSSCQCKQIKIGVFLFPASYFRAIMLLYVTSTGDTPYYNE
jgi:hypothetical protein